MTRDEDIPPDVKAIVRSCLFCPRLQSEVVYSSCSISASAVEGCLSQRFTHRHCQVTESMLVTVLCVTQLHPLTNRQQSYSSSFVFHYCSSRDLRSLFNKCAFALTQMHWGPSDPSHLTRLLHVSDDPVEGHFRAHVACVVDRLPAGLQWKAHLCQLHYCRLIYFWSWEWDKHGINNCTAAAADSTQPGACRWKLNKILLQVPLIEGWFIRDRMMRKDTVCCSRGTCSSIQGLHLCFSKCIFNEYNLWRTVHPGSNERGNTHSRWSSWSYLKQEKNI